MAEMLWTVIENYIHFAKMFCDTKAIKTFQNQNTLVWQQEYSNVVHGQIMDRF